MVRRNKEDNMKSSAPCRECTEMLKKCNIKYIIYSNDISDTEKLTKIKVKDYNTEHISLGNRCKYKYLPYVKKNPIYNRQ